MFILYANKTQLAARRREPVTSGSVNVYEVQFEFSDDWDGLTRTAVFRAGKTEISVQLVDTDRCVLPWEVLAEPDLRLWAGVYGTQSGALVLPTVWESLGTILEGALPGDETRPPTPAGTFDHRELTNRDAAEQHPIGSISGLANELSRIPEPVEALTNEELEGLLK